MGYFDRLGEEFAALVREGKLEILVPADIHEYTKRMVNGMEDEVPFTHFTTKRMQNE